MAGISFFDLFGGAPPAGTKLDLGGLVPPSGGLDFTAGQPPRPGLTLALPYVPDTLDLSNLARSVGSKLDLREKSGPFAEPFSKLTFPKKPKEKAKPGEAASPSGVPAAPGAPGTAPARTSSVGMNPDAKLAPYQASINATAQAAGVDPAVIGATILQESGGDTTALNRSSLASGLLQALPTESPSGRGRGYGYSAEQLRDPELNLRLAVPDFADAARRVDTEGRQYGWNVDDPIERNTFIIARAQRYGGDASGSGRPAYMNPSAPANTPFRHNLRQLTPPAVAAPVSAELPAMPEPGAPATPQQARLQQGLNQFNVGLSAEDALAACGPVATVWFAQNFGGTPTIGQAMDLAKQFGWNRERGAAGPASIVSTLQGLGVNATQMAPDPQSVAREIQAGRPVILDTPNHYFQIQDYNPQTGQFQFGDAVGRGRWARLDEVGQFGQGAARTAIVVRQ